jgi:hypothetical protein
MCHSNKLGGGKERISVHPTGCVGWESVVSIVTRYKLHGPEIESQWGVTFSAPIQASPGAHPASCTMGTGKVARACG